MKGKFQNRTPGKNDPMIIFVVLIIFGSILAPIGIYRYNLGKASKSWPSTSGKITYSRVESRTGNNHQEYRPSVKYTYNLDSNSYTGKQITSSDVYQRNLSAAKDILKKYPVGAEVTVYYHPGDPTKSLLEPGMIKNVYLLLGAAAFCYFLAVLILISEFRKKKRKKIE